MPLILAHSGHSHGPDLGLIGLAAVVATLLVWGIAVAVGARRGK